MSRFLIVACLVAVLPACGGSDGSSGNTSSGSSTSKSVHGSQINGGCQSPLATGGNPGASCQSYSDCAEVCCSCSTGTRGYSAQACINGKCAADADACSEALAQHSTYCN